MEERWWRIEEFKWKKDGGGLRNYSHPNKEKIQVKSIKGVKMQVQMKLLKKC